MNNEFKSVRKSDFVAYDYISKMVLVGVDHAPRTIHFLLFTYSQQSLADSGGYTLKDVIKIMKNGDYDIS